MVRPESEQPLSVLDGLTGKDFRFSAPPGYPDTHALWLVQWLDDDTVVLHAKQWDGVDLLECHILHERVRDRAPVVVRRGRARDRRSELVTEEFRMMGTQKSTQTSSVQNSAHHRRPS